MKNKWSPIKFMAASFVAFCLGIIMMLTEIPHGFVVSLLGVPGTGLLVMTVGNALAERVKKIRNNQAQ